VQTGERQICSVAENIGEPCLRVDVIEVCCRNERQYERGAVHAAFIFSILTCYPSRR
jgi:hypothetical protein